MHASEKPRLEVGEAATVFARHWPGHRVSRTKSMDTVTAVAIG